MKDMNKTIFTFGLISGGGMAVMYSLMCLARQSTSFDISQILVYAAVVLLFTMIFMGIKSYRDNALGGFITFGEAFKVGILISLVSSLCYAMLWMILYNPVFRDFMQQHSAALMEKLNTSGVPVTAIAGKKEEILKHAALYENPLLRAGIIFIQGFPVEAIMALIASFVIKKKQPNWSSAA
jgi:ethanolamine transporter EutH